MKKRIKEEKGSMAVYTITMLLSFIIILAGIFFSAVAIRQNQLKTLLKIKEVYGKNIANIEKQQPGKPPKMQIAPKKNPIVVGVGNENYLEKVLNNIQATDKAGNIVESVTENYSIDRAVDINEVGVYTVTYTASKEGYQDGTTTAKLIVGRPPSFDFLTFNYESIVTRVNSCEYGVVNLYSTAEDPQVRMSFVETEYFLPSEYRYAVIRYRCSSNLKNIIGLYATDYPKDQNYFVQADLNTDGVWHEAVLDLWSNDKIKNMDYISGIRFDYTNNGNITMDIDYIKFVKTLDIEWQYIENFDTNSYTQYTYTNLNVQSCQNSILSAVSTSGDPQITMRLPEEKWFDSKRYKFLYVTYMVAGNPGNMEFFMTPDPVDQTYSIAQSIAGNGVWNTVVFDLSANRAVYNTSQIKGWRFDPMATNGLNIQIDYIGVSDRCR